MVSVLNPTPASEPEAEVLNSVSESLRKSMLMVKGKYMTEDGSGVDYAVLEASQEWAEVLRDTSKLHYFHPLTQLPTDEAKIAFFVNLYNVLMIHGLIHKRCTKHPLEEKNPDFFQDIAYKVGDHPVSLDVIEHGILRGNRPPPGKDKGYLEPSDPRLGWAVAQVDPRIHFALNCGAKGCPRIQVYSPQNLEKALVMATQLFLQDVEIKEGDGDAEARLRVSMIFKWYGSDFGATEADIAAWICAHSRELQGKKVSKLEFVPYDWSLNQK